jgi:hypothetical protein
MQIRRPDCRWVTDGRTRHQNCAAVVFIDPPHGPCNNGSTVTVASAPHSTRISDRASLPCVEYCSGEAGRVSDDERLVSHDADDGHQDDVQGSSDRSGRSARRVEVIIGGNQRPHHEQEAM